MTTEIGWAHVPDGKGGRKIGRTLNHQVGCKEVSHACRLCYAAKLAHRGMSEQHKGLTVMRTNAAGESLGVHWNGKINRVPKMLEQPLRWRKPSGIFVGSMTDTFFDVSTDDACRWIAALFGVMAATPQHTYMLLTKRPENAAKWFAWLAEQAQSECEIQDVCMRAVLAYVPEAAERMRRQQETSRDVWPLPNVWLGVTAEDQRRADERVEILGKLPAAVRFASYEPAVGPVDWTRWIDSRWPALDWLIVGGESGPGARPSHPEWFRDAIDQCEAAGVPVFFKQWGEHGPANQHPDVEWSCAVNRDGKIYGRTTSSPLDWPRDADGMPDVSMMCRVGKAAAGRTINGRTYDGFPAVAYA